MLLKTRGKTLLKTCIKTSGSLIVDLISVGRNGMSFDEYVPIITPWIWYLHWYVPEALILAGCRRHLANIRAEGTYQCRYQIQGVIISLLPFLSPTVVLSLTKNLYKKDRRNMFAIIVLVLVTTDMYLWKSHLGCWGWLLRAKVWSFSTRTPWPDNLVDLLPLLWGI